MGMIEIVLFDSLVKRINQNTLVSIGFKMRSAYSNVWHVSKVTLTSSEMGRSVRNTYVTSCPMYYL